VHEEDIVTFKLKEVICTEYDPWSCILALVICRLNSMLVFMVMVMRADISILTCSLNHTATRSPDGSVVGTEAPELENISTVTVTLIVMVSVMETVTSLHGDFS
jgi:hypothetical protein